MPSPETVTDLPKSVVERAIASANTGRTPAEVQAELVDEGIDEATAEAVVTRLVIEAVYRHAADLLNQGYSPSQVHKQLVKNGVEPEAAATVIADLVATVVPVPVRGQHVDHGVGVLAKLLGAAVFIIGIGLFIGNTSGACPTFPFAGGITMAIGGAIFCGDQL